jgi:hypothetical protein
VSNSTETTIRLTGTAAIEIAEAADILLSKYADPIEDAREGLTVSEAREVASEDPGLVYLDASAADIVDAAIAKCSSDDPRLALFFAVGATCVGRPWGGWPEVKQAARAGDPVAVELLCRAADLAGLS